MESVYENLEYPGPLTGMDTPAGKRDCSAALIGVSKADTRAIIDESPPRFKVVEKMKTCSTCLLVQFIVLHFLDENSVM